MYQLAHVVKVLCKLGQIWTFLFILFLRPKQHLRIWRQMTVRTAGITFYTHKSQNSFFPLLYQEKQRLCACYLNLVKQFCVQQRQLIGDPHDCGNHARAGPVRKSRYKHTDKPAQMRTVPMTPEIWPLPGWDAPCGERFQHAHVSQEVSSVPLYPGCSFAGPAPDSVLHYRPAGRPAPSAAAGCPRSTPPDWHRQHQEVNQSQILCCSKDFIIHIFIQQGHIHLIKSESKDF